MKTNYYKLKITDKDGTVYYSDIQKVNFSSNTEIKIYPNPATDFITITLKENLLNKNSSINIISVDGKILAQQTIKSNSQVATIDVGKLPSGTYILKIITIDKVVNRTIQVLR